MDTDMNNHRCYVGIGQRIMYDIETRLN